MPDQPNCSVMRPEREYGQQRAVIGRYCSNSRAGPGGQHLPFADLTGRFVQSDRNAVHKQDPGPALILRGSW